MQVKVIYINNELGRKGNRGQKRYSLSLGHRHGNNARKILKNDGLAEFSKLGDILEIRGSLNGKKKKKSSLALITRNSQAKGQVEIAATAGSRSMELPLMAW